MYQGTFAVKNLPGDSSAFFEGAIPAVDKTPEAVAEFRQKAAGYPVVNTSTTVRSEDGTPLLHFIKAGMYAGLSQDEQQEMASESVKAIQELVQVYRPPPPKAKDSRVLRASQETQKAKNQAFGRYVSDQGKRDTLAYLSRRC